MACSIKILTASGTSLPQQTTANSVTVGGSAQDCAQVNVQISCAGNSKTVVATVGFNGSWAATFDTGSLGCACNGNLSVAAWCVANSQCFEETTFDLVCVSCPYVDGMAFIIDLDPLPDPPCVTQATRASVSITASGAPSNGQYVWDFDDGTPPESTNVNFVTHSFDFPGTYNVEVTYRPARAGCPETHAFGTLTVPDCADVVGPETPTGVVPTKPGVTRPGDRQETTDVSTRKPADGGPGQGGGEGGQGGRGGGRLSCDALLVAAILTLLAGGTTIALAVCTKAGFYAVLAGLVGVALGAGLFALWLAICGKITSCDVMRKMHRFLHLIVLFGVPLGLIGIGLVKLDPLCWVAIFGNLASIAWLKDRLGNIMKAAGCEPEGTL